MIECATEALNQRITILKTEGQEVRKVFTKEILDMQRKNSMKNLILELKLHALRQEEAERTGEDGLQTDNAPHCSTEQKIKAMKTYLHKSPKSLPKNRGKRDQLNDDKECQDHSSGSSTFGNGGCGNNLEVVRY